MWDPTSSEGGAVAGASSLKPAVSMAGFSHTGARTTDSSLPTFSGNTVYMHMEGRGGQGRDTIFFFLFVTQGFAVYLWLMELTV